MEISKYIVLEKEGKKDVRFFAIGVVDDNNEFTGIMHDYTGAGNYEERLVFRDKWLPDYDVDGESFDWDEIVSRFDGISDFTVEDIETEIYKIMAYNTVGWNYEILEESMKLFGDGKVLIDNMSLNVPYGLGNTTFIDGYEISETMTMEEVVKQTRIKNFRDSLSRSDAIRINSGPLLENWDVNISLGEFDLISTSWNDEDNLFEYGLSEENIENIKIDFGIYKIKKYDIEEADCIYLYRMTI